MELNQSMLLENYLVKMVATGEQSYILGPWWQVQMNDSCIHALYCLGVFTFRGRDEDLASDSADAGGSTDTSSLPEAAEGTTEPVGADKVFKICTVALEDGSINEETFPKDSDGVGFEADSFSPETVKFNVLLTEVASLGFSVPANKDPIEIEAVGGCSVVSQVVEDLVTDVNVTIVLPT